MREKINLFKNKKAIMSFNFVSMIPRVVFLVIVLITCVILIQLFVVSKFDTFDAQAEVLVSGLIYSKGGIGYYDPLTGRNYPEIIDLEQFSKADLDSAFYYPENKMIAAKISVFDKDNRNTPLEEKYYNKEWYDNWYPLLQLKALGRIKEYERTSPVIYRNESGELNSGFVYFQVVQPS